MGVDFSFFFASRVSSRLTSGCYTSCARRRGASCFTRSISMASSARRWRTGSIPRCEQQGLIRVVLPFALRALPLALLWQHLFVSVRFKLGMAEAKTPSGSLRCLHSALVFLGLPVEGCCFEQRRYRLIKRPIDIFIPTYTRVLDTFSSRQAFPQFRMAFKDSTSCFSPNSLSSLQRLLKEESRGLGLRSALALLRLSQHDPDVFYKFKQASRLLRVCRCTCVSMKRNHLCTPSRMLYRGCLLCLSHYFFLILLKLSFIFSTTCPYKRVAQSPRLSPNVNVLRYCIDPCTRGIWCITVDTTVARSICLRYQPSAVTLSLLQLLPVAPGSRLVGVGQSYPRL